MTGRLVLQGARFALHGERSAAACVARCLLCRAESGLVEYGEKAAAVWSIEHTRRYGPDHGQFVLTEHRGWWVGPVVVSGARQAAPSPPPRGVPAAARGRGRRRERRVRRLVAAAVVTVVLMACAWVLPG